METLKTLGTYVPLFQTLLWVGLILVALRIFLPQLKAVLEAIQVRVEKGSGLEIGLFKLPADLQHLETVPQQTDSEPLVLLDKELDYAGLSSEVAPTMAGEKDVTALKLNEERNRVYEQNRNLFITHVIQPSSERGQKYDVFIYLIRHRGGSFEDVEYCDFFLGPYWGNKVFRRHEEKGKIGLSTAAYGTFLCTCWVQMKDGERIFLTRYIDFEMSRLFEKGA